MFRIGAPVIDISGEQAIITTIYPGGQLELLYTNNQKEVHSPEFVQLVSDQEGTL